jgi:hypothetical protein
MRKLNYILILSFFLLSLGFTKKAFAEQDEWHINITSGGMDARVTYYTQLHQSDAMWVKEAVEKAWPLYKTQTGVQPAATVNLHVGDVFLLSENPNESPPDGLTGYENGVCTIYIAPGDIKKVKTTTAHELFHCWQQTMELKPYSQNTWMYEATAVWSEDWVYKDYASEHQYDELLFKALDSNLLDTGNTREYAGYLYFYKLYQQDGFSPTPVITLLKQLKTKNQEQIIKGQSGIHENIKEFAFWNWNKDPFKEYSDTPEFPPIRPSGSSIKSLPITTREEYKAKFHTEGGGAQYIATGFEEGVDKVVFKVSEYNTLNNPQIGMQALIKINDEWHYEDWSDQTEKTFCRNREAEKIQIVVLIASNSNIKDTVTYAGDGTEQYTDGGAHDGEMTIDATGECPVTWHGTVRYTNSGGGTELKVGQTLTINEELEEVMDENGEMTFEIVKQDFNYVANHSTNMPCMYPCSGNIAVHSISLGNTTRVRPENEEYPSRRFLIGDDDKPIFIVEPQMYGECDYVTMTQKNNYACSCGGNASTNAWTDVSRGGCHTVNGIETVHKIPTEFSQDGKRITGRESGISPAGYFGATIEWDYVYE